MPLLFILAIILAVVGLLILLFGKTAFASAGRDDSGDQTERRPFNRALAFGTLGVAVALLLLSSMTMVSTRNVGVLTEFGRPVGALPNGLHFKAPWQQVTELDGAIQTDNYVGDGCTQIRIGTEGTACVENTVRWRIRQEAGDELFQDYRNFDNIRDSLVTRELNAALNDVLSDFNPLNAVEDDGTDGTNLDDIGRQVTDRLDERIGDRVEVYNVLIPLIAYNEKTQERLDAYQEEIANTRIAQQRQQTASAEAQANRELAASVSNDPNVLVSRCIDVLGEMVREGQPVPAGFSCWPGGDGTLVVPAATTPPPRE